MSNNQPQQCLKPGVLIVNLGTPSSPDTRSVRRYLKQFLSDPAVITLPGWARWLLLRLIILPFRSPKSAKAYRSIWTESGSPLLVYSQAFTEKLQQSLGDTVEVVLAMRYGEPSILSGLQQLSACDEIIVIPMYPQFANATTQSTIDEVERCAQQLGVTERLQWIRDFYHQPGFAKAFASNISTVLAKDPTAYLLMSYHGLPKSHLPSACHARTCYQKTLPCEDHDGMAACYRVQCFHSSRAIAAVLGLNKEDYGVSFQSRLGTNAWIQPYTDKVLQSLFEKGVRRLAVACPAFVTDCIETLEEIEMELKEQWIEMGGESLSLIPCLNDSQGWVDTVSEWIQEKLMIVKKEVV